LKDYFKTTKCEISEYLESQGYEMYTSSKGIVILKNGVIINQDENKKGDN